MTQKIILLPNVEPKDQPGNILNWRALQLSLKYLAAAFGSGGALGVANRVLFYDASGNLTSSANLTFDGNSIAAQSNSQSLFTLATSITAAGGAAALRFRKSRGTIGFEADVQNGDALMYLNAQAYSGSYMSTAEIDFVVDAVVVSGQRPASRIEFYTNANNAGQVLQLSIDRNGKAAFTGTIVVGGDLKLTTVGSGIYVKTGTNATFGTATLVGGTVTISTTKITANSGIMLGVGSGTLTNIGTYKETARTAGASFVITSTNILDASTFSWWLLEPA